MIYLAALTIELLLLFFLMHQQHCGVMLTNAVKQISYKNLNIRHYQIAHKGFFFLHW